MARYFGEQFLTDLRAALPVLTVVSKRHTMKKVAANEYAAVDDPSLKVNSSKNIWHDFGKGQTGGDAIDFLMHSERCTFEEAVEIGASIAGIALPGRKTNGHGEPPAYLREGPPPTEDRPARSPQKQITARYPFQDADGSLVYEVVRLEWQEDGARRKVTTPRRPLPEDPTRWVWGLKAGEYVRSKNGDFYIADAKRKATWRGAELRTFDETAPTLYRLPAIREELGFPADEQRVIFLPEGEKDADTLAAWDLLATTNIGGTNGWRPYYAEYLSGADVVIPMDNDTPGKSFAHHKAASLKPFARRVRLLDLRDWWPEVWDKADITDWRDKAGGTRERLLEIVDKLPDWTPAPPESRFGAIRFADLDRERRQLEWLVKGILTQGEVSLWYGASGCGKSFLLTDLAFAVARGLPNWMGCRCKAGLVVYQAGESGMGFQLRMKAYRQRERLSAEKDLPFVALPVRINLWKDDADTDALIIELRAWAAYYGWPLELVVIDTFNVATTGADENASRDVGPILGRARRIANELHCHVAIIHHMNARGDKPRGHTSLMADADNAVEVEELDQKHVEDGRSWPIRQMIVSKQRDGERGLARQFILRQVVLGQDADGDDRTSCAVEEVGNRMAALVGAERAAPPGWATLSEDNQTLMRCLVRAIRRKGRAAPAGVEAPAGANVCLIEDWQNELIELQIGHVPEVTNDIKAALRRRIARACERWAPDRPDGPRLVRKQGEYVWRTGRCALGVDELPKPRPELKPILAPGDDERWSEHL